MKISKVRNVKTPTRGTDRSAGIDFYVPEDQDCLLLAGESCLIPSGIKANVPKGYALIAFNKSGVAVKKNLHVGACVVDEDYQGEIHINLTNVGTNPVTMQSGEKIVQFVLLPVFYDDVEEVSVESLYENETARGSGGFGSTGEY
jgi:dUTP pyrophosphatase